MRKANSRTLDKSRNQKNMKDETHTKEDLEYGEKTVKHGK
jgi:hypothetical protein